MSSTSSFDLRSPNTLSVITVALLMVLFSISGMVAPTEVRESPLAAFVAHHPKRYSQFNEEVLIRYYFRDKRDGIFVDVGCAWPVRNSTTCYLERHLGWTGLAVDALAEYGDEWVTERPRSRFRQYAVSDQSGGTITFYKAAWSGVSSLSEEHATKFTGVKPTPIEVPAITLNDLLEEEGIQSFDFLSLDIEGAELSALAGLDIERFGPRLVCIEGRGRDNSNEVRAYFEARGYDLIEEFKPYDKVNYYFGRRF